MSALIDLLPFGGVLSFLLGNWTWLAPLAGGGLGAFTIAVPYAGPILAFVAANWKWLLPTIGMVAALMWAAVAQIGWESCRTAAAQLEVKRQEEINKQHETDRRLGNELLNGQLTANERTDHVQVKTVEVIRNVPVTRDCSQSPAMRAAHDGLRQLGFPEQAGPAAGRDAQAPTPAAARPRRRERQRHRRGAHRNRRLRHQARAQVRRSGLLRAGEEAALLKAARGVVSWI
jgi:hypothetical protein